MRSSKSRALVRQKKIFTHILFIYFIQNVAHDYLDTPLADNTGLAVSYSKLLQSKRGGGRVKKAVAASVFGGASVAAAGYYSKF